MVCGGDGGSAVHGGDGTFLVWLTLATAYRDQRYAAFVQKRGADFDRVLIRPAIDLSD